MSEVTGLYGGGSKFLEGRKMQKEAERLIDDFEYSDLENVQEGRQVSTLGSDLIVENASSQAESSVQALRSGGSRSIQGGLGAVEARRAQETKKAAVNLDEQEKQIQEAIASDNATIRNMKERRESEEIAGYGQMLNVGRTLKQQGVTDVYNTFAAAEEQALEVASMMMGMPSMG